jgi:hypothetical protein
MPKATPKLPGLQAKFQSALKQILEAGPKKTSQITAAISQDPSRFDITVPELDDLNSNFSNYIGRAKDAGIVNSPGKGKGLGYSLLQQNAAIDAASSSILIAPLSIVSTQSAEDSNNQDVSSKKSRAYWESFAHLPMTVVLSELFMSRVKSLPVTTHAVRWGNPDALMIRASSRAAIKDINEDLDPELFRMADVGPDCILSSIELKWGLDRDRAKVYSALAEAAANSRWANEAWLVIANENTGSIASLGDDVVSLARDVHVGLIEIAIPSLETIVHHSAPQRPTLRIDEIDKERGKVLLAAQELFKVWNGDSPTFLDHDGSHKKARNLLNQAVQNLATQSSFQNLHEGIKALRGSAPTASDVTKQILSSVVDLAMSAVSADEGQSNSQFLAALQQNVDDMKVSEAAALRDNLRIFGHDSEPSPSTDCIRSLNPVGT